MKILQMPAYFLPEKGGIEHCVYYLAEEFLQAGNRVTVLTSGKRNESEDMGGIMVQRVPAWRVMKSPVSLQLFFALMREQPDVAHLHYPHPFWLETGALVCRLKGIPYVVHCHGKEIEISGWKNALARCYNRTVFSLVLQGSAAIVTNTRKVIPQSRLLQQYRRKITTIPHGIDLRRFAPGRKAAQQAKTILHVGSLRRYKGVEYIIAALPAVLARYPDTRLVIVGKGEQEGVLRKQAEQMGVAGHVEFRRSAEPEELRGIYARADAFVLASPTIEESFGLVAFEALAMEVPTIVTSGAGVSEIFEDEGIPHVVAPRDPGAIAQRVIEVFSHRQKSYRNILEKYQWERIAPQYLALYQQVMR